VRHTLNWEQSSRISSGKSIISLELYSWVFQCPAMLPNSYFNTVAQRQNGKFYFQNCEFFTATSSFRSWRISFSSCEFLSIIFCKRRFSSLTASSTEQQGAGSTKIEGEDSQLKASSCWQRRACSRNSIAIWNINLAYVGYSSI